MVEKTSSSEHSDVIALSEMLQGELLAVEAYNDATMTLRTIALASELERIREDHRDAVRVLQWWIRYVTGPRFRSCDNGFSGNFTPTESGSVIFAAEPGMLLISLKRVERVGDERYRLGLGNPDLPDAVRFLIGSRLLAHCQEHLSRLEQWSTADSSKN